ncbi:MAG: STAS/SEC14 domain-containing protein [Rhizobiaceae bacterium]
MSVLNDPPNIRRLDSTRPELFAVEITGHLTASDVENLYGLLEGFYVLHDRVDLLMRIVEFEGVEWRDVSPETIEAASQHAEHHIARCATVGEHGAGQRIADIFCPPAAETRHFSTQEEDQAWEWLGEAG